MRSKHTIKCQYTYLIIIKRLKTPCKKLKKQLNKNFVIKIQDSYWLFVWAERDKHCPRTPWKHQSLPHILKLYTKLTSVVIWQNALSFLLETLFLKHAYESNQFYCDPWNRGSGCNRSSLRQIWPNVCYTTLPVKVNQKLSFLVFLFFNISFDPEFGNPSLESLEKQNVFNFQITFSAIVDFILWFCTRLSSETWSFELISQLLLFDDQQQKKVF